MGVFGDVPNTSFSNPILVMRSDPTEGYCLVSHLDIINKRFVHEPAIITMIVLDSRSMLFSQTFESMFCINCLIRC